MNLVIWVNKINFFNKLYLTLTKKWELLMVFQNKFPKISWVPKLWIVLFMEIFSIFKSRKLFKDNLLAKRGKIQVIDLERIDLKG